MMHYDPTKKSKKRSCYIGGYAGLTYVDFEDERVSLYKYWLKAKALNTDEYKNLDEDEKMKILPRLLNLLIKMGWPKRFVLEKFSADQQKLFYLRKYAKAEEELEKSAFPEKMRRKLDYSKIDDYINEDLSKILSK
jgi:hypothetical protein